MQEDVAAHVVCVSQGGVPPPTLHLYLAGQDLSTEHRFLLRSGEKLDDELNALVCSLVGGMVGIVCVAL